MHSISGLKPPLFTFCALRRGTRKTLGAEGFRHGCRASRPQSQLSGHATVRTSATSPPPVLTIFENFTVLFFHVLIPSFVRKLASNVSRMKFGPLDACKHGFDPVPPPVDAPCFVHGNEPLLLMDCFIG